MRKLMLGWMAMFVMALAATLTADETEKKDLGWCEVETPKQVAAGSEFVVKVTVKKDIKDTEKVGGDLHFVNSEGIYAGFAKWGGAPKAVKKGEVTEFKYKMPAAKEGMKGIIITYYLTETDFKACTEKASTPAVEFK